MTIKKNSLYIDHIAISSKTASDWTTENPVLLKGELGFESDTQRMKCGDGIKNWKSLSYLDAGIQTSITNLTERVEDLEELALAIMKTTTSIINNIMKGELNPNGE